MTGAVLIVDDSLTVRMDLADAFERAGFQPLPCSTVSEARGTLEERPIALIVLDVLLPDGDGIELLKEIRLRDGGADLPVLLLSTEAEVKDRIRGLQTGADDYVGKPYDTGYVVARARELLQREQLRSSAEAATILVVDDSVTFREELRGALERSGYSVILAESGEDGLRMAAASRPTALIVDSVMPGIDGTTVIRRIRLDGALSGTPCLLLTGSEGSTAELRALDAGADAFARKEEDLKVVLARLATIIRNASGTGSPVTSLLGPKRILAVDDSMTYLQEVSRVLRGDGYDVVLARSGEEAIEMLAVQPVDCILLDLLMPGLGGREACKRIKTSPVVGHIPLIILTAVEDPDSMLDGLGAGADDYISKASEFEILKARVRAQMRRKQFEDEHRRIREALLKSELEAKAAQKAAEARAALVAELKRKNRELEAFSYSVSHDLRAPLRGISGFSEALVRDYADKLDERGLGYLRRVQASAQRMGELIDDLLELSRVTRAELRRARVDLSKLARVVTEDLARKEPSRTVSVQIQEGLFVDGDSSLLRIVLENLLGNAWKFTARVPLARIEVSMTNQEDEPVYTVRDNGAGFDMKYVSKLFNPFQRLHGEAEYPGTGIGLATVHRIVDRHGGRIWADAASGAGATFYFTIPRADVSEVS
ncbi:MAG TPA: response regulator [Polyangiaceae bacterium]|nr:response regulator [Polyangiaceae bacterium]